MFTSESEAIKWVEEHIPFMVKTVSKKAKHPLTLPFTSPNAAKQVIEGLGKELFKLTNQQDKKCLHCGREFEETEVPSGLFCCYACESGY